MAGAIPAFISLQAFGCQVLRERNSILLLSAGVVPGSWRC
jgi:hypothetical protein